MLLRILGVIMAKKEQNLYSIGQLAEKLGVNADTIRKWERAGKIDAPLRVGPRKDRKFTDEHVTDIIEKGLAKPIEQTVKTLDKSQEQMTLAELKQFLWKSADILRNRIDSSEYKKYIFGLLFYKRINDIWQEEYDKAMEEYAGDEDVAKADYMHRFQVPEDCRWEVIAGTSENIGEKLNEIFDKITNANSPKLDKVFDDLDFANKDKFPNEVLQNLINHFSKYNFGESYFSTDVLGDAYEYLIEQFAADAGKKGGQYYTPREVERVIIQILKPHKKDQIYDPTVGSAGFLLEAFHYLRDKESESAARTLYLYGQEIELSTYAIAKINMFLHGLDEADIRRGDTLSEPQFLNSDGALKTFDICVANFPYSIKEWPHESFKNDRYGRLEGYTMPPKKNADYAFILHILASLNQNGRAGIVVPHGVLFRPYAEARIREQMIRNDVIEAVISLPEKLFYGVGIPAAILILNKNKPETHKNNIQIINGEHDYEEGKKQNRLRKQDIEKIVDAFDSYADEEGYARVVGFEEIGENDFNLNVRRYIADTGVEEDIDVSAIWSELQELEEERDAADEKVKGYLKELHY